jgi:hypothetical protein
MADLVEACGCRVSQWGTGHADEYLCDDHAAERRRIFARTKNNVAGVAQRQRQET